MKRVLFIRGFSILFILSLSGLLPGAVQARPPKPGYWGDENIWVSSIPKIASAGLRILETDSRSVVVEMVAPAPTFVHRSLEGQVCQEVQVTGVNNSGQPGWPSLPTIGAIIGIPAQGRILTEVLEQETATIPGDYRLCPVSSPDYEVGIEGVVTLADKQTVWEPVAYLNNQFSPTSNFDVAPAGKIRSQDVAVLRYFPVQYNPVSREVRFNQRLVVRLTFITGDGYASLPTGPGVNEGFYEPTLQQSILNYEQARSWRTRPTPIPQAKSALPNNSQPIFRVEIDQSGIYELTYQDLQAAGFPVNSVDPIKLQVWGLNGPVATYVEGEGDGIFDPNDYLLFYAEAIDSKYSKTNTYWVGEDITPGIRMPGIDGTPGGPAQIPAHFLTGIHLETNKIYQSARPSGVNKDHWYWEGLQATSSTVSKDFYFTLKNISTEPVDIIVRGQLRGYSASPQQWARIYLNGNLIEDFTWLSDTEYTFEQTAPQSYLMEGNNTLTVEAPLGSGISSQTFFVNWLEIDYYDKFTAENDQLTFDGDIDGTWEYHLNGFTTSAIDIYDVTVPGFSKRILNANITGSGASYQAVFRHQIWGGEFHYLAQSTANRMQPLTITVDYSEGLKSPYYRVDYLIITHANFFPEAQRLADYRSKQNYKTEVVDIQDIYDVFNGGVPDPRAIRDFLAYAYANWTPPAPSYVVLLGDGHYDPKNYLNYYQPYYILPYLDDVDPFLGETVSDNRLVTISGNDTLPDMHIGRLPANTLAEATAMVDKIIAYENDRPQDNWNKNVLFVTDNPDSGGDFHVLSDSIADYYLPSPYLAEKIYYGWNYTLPADAKLGILNAINQGRLLVSYIGHASVQWWAYEQLLTVNDIPTLTNSDRLTFFVPMTCLEGYFINPQATSQSLAEMLTRADKKGSIASWSPTGLGVATGHDSLEKALFSQIFNQNEYTIGPATDNAKIDFFANTIGFHDLLDTYMLFGDPATRLNTVFALTLDNNFIPMVRAKP